MQSRLIFAAVPLSFLLARAGVAQGTTRELPLKITLSAEEPTGVFFDRDTISPQTPLLFTARIENPSPEARNVELSWKITDSSGRVRLARESQFTVAGGDSLLRRELFDAPARGGYLLQTEAFSKLKGPDARSTANLPFAVTVAPTPNSGAARPQSFFVLSTPALLSNSQLDFYSRFGARVLRSPLPPDPSKPDWSAIEAQLGARLKRNLATIALLPLGEESSRRSQAFFARQVPSTLARYGSLTTWELAGDISPSDLDAWSQVARARRSDIALLGPLPTGISDGLPPGASIRIDGLEGATFGWPEVDLSASANKSASADAKIAANSTIHPDALRRLWLSRAGATRSAGVGAFHLRRDDEPKSATPDEAAAQLTDDYLSAIMAGATSMSEKLTPPTIQVNEELGPDTSARDAVDGAGAMARGAAFSMLSRTLEDASYREPLFPRSAAYEGALFRAPRGSIAILYATRGEGKMTARISGARVYDIFGNQISADKNGALEVPLSGQPVFVLAEVPTDVLGFALRNAQVTGISPLAAQFLPLSRVPGQGEGSASVRVRLQNIGIGQQSGQLTLGVPKTWKLATKAYDFQLGEGESKTYEFRATLAPLNPKWPQNQVPLSVSTGGKNRLSFEENVPISSATSVSSAVKIDGDLGEWADAIYQVAPQNKARVSAKVAFKWDARYLYIAAQVREAALAPRRADEGDYQFWHAHDALQIAFGTSNGPETAPSVGPFRDSDRGFLLAPFGQRGPRDYDGRVLQLWAPEKPFNTVTDRVRYGGAVAGASCAITRDEKAGLTFYEARLPFAALPGVDPQELAARDGAIRFGWILHNDEGSPLDYGKDAGNFPWWDNTATFLPDGTLSSSLRLTLGFTQSGAIEAASKTAPNAVVAPVKPVVISPPTVAPRATVPSFAAPTTLAAPTTIAPVKAAPTVVSPITPSVVVPSVVPVVPAPRLPSGVPAPSGPLSPGATPPEIAPFIVPSTPSNTPQPLPPASPSP